MVKFNANNLIDAPVVRRVEFSPSIVNSILPGIVTPGTGVA